MKVSAAPSPSHHSPHLAEVHARGFDDEIDLLELIRAVLATWKAWLLSALLVSLLFAVYQGYTYLAAAKDAPYTKVVSLTFSGADRGTYPNGAPYRIQDIVAPAVLQSVYRDLGVAEHGVSLTELQNRISIEPYSPYYREIMAKYDALLAGMKTQDYSQIEAVEERKRRELSGALNGAARLSFDPAGLGLPEALITKLLNAIPLEWARQAIADKGVLKSDIQLTSERTLDDVLFVDVDYPILGDLFVEKVNALRDNIRKVKALPGAATVRDPETGWAIRDLEANLYDLETYRIDELMSPIRSLGLSRNPDFAVYYFTQRKIALEDEIDRLQEEGMLIQTAYTSYYPKAAPTASAEISAVQGVSPFPGFLPSVSPELIDKLLQAAGDDSVEKYRQLLNDRWLATKLKMAKLKSDIRTIDCLITTLQDGGNSVDADLRKGYLQRAEQGVPEILAQLRSFYRINERIYEQINRERIGGVGYLYKDGHQGVLRAGSGVNLKRVLLLYIALMAAVTFVVVPVTMIRNAMRAKSSSKPLNREFSAAA